MAEYGFNATLLHGVYEDLIRISVGIEDIEDLKQDFKNAIEGEK